MKPLPLERPDGVRARAGIPRWRFNVVRGNVAGPVVSAAADATERESGQVVRMAWRRLLTGRRDAARECADIAKHGNSRASSPPPPFESRTRAPRAPATRSLAYRVYHARDVRVYSDGADIGARRKSLRWTRGRDGDEDDDGRSAEKSAGRVYDWPGTAPRMNCGQWMSLLALDEAVATRARLIRTRGAHARPCDRRPRKRPRGRREFRIWHDAARFRPRPVVVCLSLLRDVDASPFRFNISDESSR